VTQRWYVTKDGRNRLGPYSTSARCEMAGTGLLSPEDMVLVEGQDQWIPTRSFPGLLPDFGAPPPTTANSESGRHVPNGS
jgi:hypothetical protein